MAAAILKLSIESFNAHGRLRTRAKRTGIIDFFQRFVAEAIYDRGIPAAEERREEVAKDLNGDEQAHTNTGSLHLDSDLEEPEDYRGVEWHLMPGGWDGYDLSSLMFVKGVMPYIFRHGGFAAVEVGVDTSSQRMDVLNHLPKDNYQRFYDCGCGGTSTLAVIRQKFPHAELVGGDVSRAMLEGGHKVDQALGLNVTLKQEDCRNTSEPDNYYDAVVSYAVFHEVSDETASQIIKEMYRILAPGGDFIVSDPGPLKALTPYQAVLADWETDHREEPHFGASIRRSLPDIMCEAGFVDVKDFGVGKGNYPWVTLGSKPEA